MSRPVHRYRVRIACESLAGIMGPLLGDVLVRVDAADARQARSRALKVPHIVKLRGRKTITEVKRVKPRRNRTQ